MFGMFRRNKTVAPAQTSTTARGASPVHGITLAASTKSSVERSALTMVHSRDQASTLARKALMSRVMAMPPTHTNSVLARGLAVHGVAGFASAATPLTNSVTPSCP